MCVHVCSIGIGIIHYQVSTIYACSPIANTNFGTIFPLVIGTIAKVGHFDLDSDIGVLHNVYFKGFSDCFITESIGYIDIRFSYTISPNNDICTRNISSYAAWIIGIKLCDSYITEFISKTNKYLWHHNDLLAFHDCGVLNVADNQVARAISNLQSIFTCVCWVRRTIVCWVEEFVASVICWKNVVNCLGGTFCFSVVHDEAVVVWIFHAEYAPCTEVLEYRVARPLCEYCITIITPHICVLHPTFRVVYLDDDILVDGHIGSCLKYTTVYRSSRTCNVM